MKKKKPSPLEAAFETFVPDPEAFTDEDAEQILDGAGADRNALHQRVAEMARNTGAALRKKGVAAPPVLRDVVDALDHGDALPRDFELARARAAKHVADLEKTSAIDRDYRLLEAARKGPGSLSEKDRRLLDDEKADFQRELDEEHDETE